MTQGRVGIQAIVPVSITTISVTSNTKVLRRKWACKEDEAMAKKTQQHNNPELLLF